MQSPRRVVAGVFISVLLVAIEVSANSGQFIGQSARTTPRGKIELQLLTQFWNYNTPDPRTDVLDFVAVASFGLMKQISATVVVPFSWTSGTPENLGFKDLETQLKLALLQKEDVLFSLSSKISVPTGKKEQLLGNGQTNYRMTAHLTFPKGTRDFSYSIGVGRSEYVQGGYTKIKDSQIFAEDVGGRMVQATEVGIRTMITQRIRARFFLRLEAINIWFIERDTHDLRARAVLGWDFARFRMHAAFGSMFPGDNRATIRSSALFGLTLKL